MALYFAAEFSLENNPTDLSNESFFISKLAWKLSDWSQYLAWLLLALDLKKLGDRTLKLNIFLV